MKKVLCLSLIACSIFSMQLDIISFNKETNQLSSYFNVSNVNKVHIQRSSVFVPNQLGSVELYSGKRGFSVCLNDKKHAIQKCFTAFESPLDIIDINVIVTRYLIQSNDDFMQAVHDVKAISLITRNSVLFLSQKDTINTIALVFSHKFKINKPLVIRTLNMNESKQWLACFKKSINADDLLAQALINDDIGIALEALNSGADIDSFNFSLSDPALIYAVKKLNPKMVRFLIKNGGDINIRDKQGETAFIVATKCDNVANSMEMLNVIDEFHPNKSLKDNNGLTAIDWVMLRS